MPYIPHTAEDIRAMLTRIGVSSLDALFDEIPVEMQCDALHTIPDGMSEMAMLKEAERLASLNQNGICFIGAGSYDHHIPAAVWDIASRGEFLTAYTPYQAEASQGTLQLLYEYQTMIAALTGMAVANASMYDGATALAEAILMAIRIQRQSKMNRVLVAGTLHPFYRDTIQAIVCHQHIEIIYLPFDKKTGATSMDALAPYAGEDVTALVIPQPNFFGQLEPVDAMTDWARENHTISIGCVNPVSLALLKPPGQWGRDGADIVCGEGQPLGAPIASGGPYFGFFATTLPYVRQMPGRLIGRTTDMEGKTGYTLTLQAREQHIRRGKATSNICTNQGLLVTAATIHMSLLGAEGLQHVARQCHMNTHKLVEALTAIDGVERVFDAPCFHEALVRFKKPVHTILSVLQDAGIAGGYSIEAHYPTLKNTLLICATEKRTAEECMQYVDVIKQLMANEA